MQIGGDAEILESAAERIGAALTVVVSDYNRRHHKPAFCKLLAQSKHVHIIGYAQIGAYLVFFNILCADYNHDFSLVGQLAKHTQLAVGLESRKHAAGVMVVE